MWFRMLEKEAEETPATDTNDTKNDLVEGAVNTVVDFQRVRLIMTQQSLLSDTFVSSRFFPCKRLASD